MRHSRIQGRGGNDPSLAALERGLPGPCTEGETSVMALSAVCPGGGSGIGRATSVALADRGVHVMVGDVDLDGAQETARLIEARGGVAHWHQVDVADEAQVEEFVARGIATHGPLDCAANVAGTHAGLGACTAEVTAV